MAKPVKKAAPFSDLTIERKLVADLHAYENNPRVNDHAVPKMAETIRKFGFLVPVLFRSDGTVVDGHLRLKAAKRIGMTDVPAIRVDHLSDDDIKALRININRTAEWAEWDESMLRVEVGELKESGYDLATLGFDQEQIDNFLSGQGLYEDSKASDPHLPDNIDDIPEIPVNPKSKVGEVYLLGPHKLLCGDCTDQTLVNRLFTDGMADMLWTDPPWNVAYGASGKPSSDDDRKKRGGKINPAGWSNKAASRVIINDALGDKFPEFCKQFCSSFAKFTKPGAPAYVVMSAQEWPIIHATLTEAGFHWSSTIIWAKDRQVLSRKDYHTQYEPMWYGWKDDAPRRVPLLDRTQTDLWNIPRPARSDEHPMMKPIALIARSISNSSKPKDLIFDPFGGSGSTLIASATTKRRAITCELDPKFADVIRKRWTRWADENKVEAGPGALRG